MHRRLKSAVADQLPPKRRECVRLELSGAAAKRMAEANARLGELMAQRAAAEASASTSGREGSSSVSASDARFEVRKALSAWGGETSVHTPPFYFYFYFFSFLMTRQKKKKLYTSENKIYHVNILSRVYSFL